MSTIETQKVMNQVNLAYSQADMPLELKLENASKILARLQEDFIASLDYANADQLRAVVAAAESDVAIKVPGYNTTFRLSKDQKDEVKQARERHSVAMTLKRDEIAETVARSTITSYKYKMAKDGKTINGKLAFVAPRRLPAA